MPGAIAVCLFLAGLLPGAQGQTITPVSIATNMGTANVCPAGAATPSPCSHAATLSFKVSAGTTVGSVNVVTQGTPNLDFVATTPDASATLCTAQTYASATTCTVDVTFAPRFPGMRMGAVVLRDGADNVLATSYLAGTGTGPQAGFFPGTKVPVSLPGDGDILAIAVDSAGGLYLSAGLNTLSANLPLLKETPSGDGYVETRVGTFQNVFATAVDGAGNVFAASGYPDAVFKETPSGGGYSQTTTFDAGFSGPQGIAVDGGGRVYISDTGNQRVVTETPSANGYVQDTLDLPGLGYAGEIEVDASGNLYFAGSLPSSSSTSVLVKETLSGGSYTETLILATSIAAPVFSIESFAVDAAGSVFVSESKGNGRSQVGRIVKEIPSGGSYLESVVALGSGASAFELALDGSGNLWVPAGLSFGPTVKFDFADPPALSFAAGGGANSNLIQTLTVENSGNAPLTFPVPSSGSNPNLSSNFTLTTGEPEDCPLVSSESASAGILAAGNDCLLPIRFTPGESGASSGSLILTDDSLNASAPAWATHTITLSGQATSTLFGGIGKAVDATTLVTTVAQADNLLVSGYAVDSSAGAPVSRVSVLVDGTPVGNATLGIARPDVAASWNNSADLNSGWTLTTAAASLAVGTHAVTAVAYDSGGSSSQIGATTIKVAASPVPGPPYGALGEAVDAATNSTTVAQADTLAVTGWAEDVEDGAPVKQVTIAIDGKVVGSATLGIDRPDVALRLNLPMFPYAGWTFS
ncbi:MAG TPA: hypothetical protein VHX60_05720 [Acidobacteriaceae bacterium]|nr:hypothetical protein [Acidobacteriaceae bacterium]